MNTSRRLQFKSAVLGIALVVSTAIQFGVSSPVFADSTPTPAPSATPITSPAPGDASSATPRATATPNATAPETSLPVSPLSATSRSAVTPQIVGGVTATIADAPWQVALVSSDRTVPEFDGQFCGGSIIATQWILTAAHCVFDEQEDGSFVQTDPTSINVLAGQATLVTKADTLPPTSKAPNSRSVTVAEIKVHPLYDPTAEHDDVALLKLTSALTLVTGQKQKINLPTQRNYEGASLITGWGSTASGENAYPTVLRKADVTVLPDSACTDSYPDSFDGSKMLCAGTEAFDRDTCQGDSGGPLAANKGATGTVPWYLVGITSYGIGCANGQDPGVYTEVFNYVSWINQYAGVTSATISGQIKEQATQADSATPLPHAEVFMWKASDVGKDGADYTWTVADADGKYSLLPPSAGDYVLEFRPPADDISNLVAEWYNDKPVAQLATRITFGTTAKPNIDAVLSNGATISGTLTHVVDGQEVPFEGAYACAFVTQEESFCAVTDTEGYYEIANLGAGSYKLHFDVSQTQTIEVLSAWWGNAAGYDSATAVTLGGGASVTGKDFSLPVAGSISGSVTGSLTDTPQALSGILVNAYDANTLDLLGSSITDETGSYTILGLDALSYKLQFVNESDLNLLDEWYNNAGDASVATSIPLAKSQQLVGKDIVLDRGAAVSGTVTFASQPLENVDVSMFVDCCDDRPFQTAQTDAEGHYSFQKLQPGKYYLKFDAPEQPTLVTEYLGHSATRLRSAGVALGAGQIRADADFEMKSGATISGSVTLAADGSPATGTRVSAYSITGRYAGKGGIVDEAGQYTITGIGPGTFYIKADPTTTRLNAVPQWADAKSSPLTANAVTLDYEQEHTTNFSLTAGSTIAGTVSISGSGDPLSEKLVTVWQWGDPSVNYRSPYARQWTAWTDQNGAYRVVGLEPGTYKVCVEGDPTDELVSRGCFGGAISVDEADPVVVASGDDVSANITVRPVGSISGTVTNSYFEDAAPEAGQTVYLFQAGHIPVLYQGLAQTVTGEDGSYTFSDLPEGDYIIRVGGGMWDEDIDYVPEYFEDSYWFNSATAITVNADESAVANFDVSPRMEPVPTYSALSGRVVTSAGAGVPNVTVTSVCSGSWGFATTDALGSYKIDYLTPGSCRITYGPGYDATTGAPLNYLSAIRIATLGTAATTLTNQVLVAGGSISGTVKNATGTGVQANVAVVDLSGNCVGILQSSPSGAFTLPRLATGSYRVGVTDSCTDEGGAYSWNNYRKITQGNSVPDRWFGGKAFFAIADTIAVTAGSVTAGKDIVVSTESRTLSGTVSRAQASGDPTAQSDVTIVLSPWTQQKMSSRDPSTVSNADGTFALGKLAPGDYFATIVSAGAPNTVWRGSDGVGDPEKIRITSGQDSTDFALTLPKLQKVTAIVATPSSLLKFCHSYDALPSFTDSKGNRFVASWPDAWTDASAAFVTSYLPVETYTFSLTCLGSTLWFGGATKATATPISVQDGIDPEVIKWNLATAATGTGSISGVVSSTVGGRLTPVAEVNVSLFDGTNSTLLAMTTTNVNGAYGFTGIPFGSYKVFFNHPNELSSVDGRPDFASKWNGGAATKSLASIIQVSSGTRDVVDANATLTTATGTVQAGQTAITGTFRVGATLTASPGTWTSGATLLYQWTRVPFDASCSCFYEAPVPIPGATSSTYVLQSADAGYYVGLAIIGEKSGLVSSTSAVNPGLVQGTAMVAGTPTITGTVAVGNTLSANKGTWTPASPTLGYQWRRGAIDIPGATESTYQVTPADVGAPLSVIVIGSASNYQMAAGTSAATASVALGTLTKPTPTISGVPAVGNELTGVPGTWGPGSVDLTYQWLRGTTVVGTSLAYTVVSADRGQSLTFKVSGAKTGYSSTSATSTAVTGVNPFTQSPTPTISVSGGGSPAVGKTLTATPGTWSPTPTLTYLWKRGADTISGATTASYTLSAADEGKAITVTVTATLSTYPTTPKTSQPTEAVAKGSFTSTPVPTVTTGGVPVSSGGVVATGVTLTAVPFVSPAVWVPTQDSFTYQWFVGESAVADPSASQTTYLVKPADLGKQITVKVTAKKAGYTDTSRSSVATAAVTYPLIATAPTPTITVSGSGAAAVGKTLTVVPGTTPAGATITGYQWKRGTSATGEFTDIPGATSSATYTLTSDDDNKFIRAQVTWAKSGNADTPKWATTLAIAKGTFITTPSPVLSGTLTVGETLTVDPGSWSPSQDGNFTYVWKRAASATATSWSTISGVSGNTYQLAAADRGQFIRVEVTGSRAGYNPATLFKVSSAAILAPMSAPTPTISVSGGGVAAVGKTLTATPGSWSPSPTLTYVWKRGTETISGATTATYTLTATDEGKAITVTVTGTLATYVQTSKTSVATDPVVKGSFTTAPTPTISGNSYVSQALTGSATATWSPAPTSYTYQWYRGDSPIGSPTTSTLTTSSYTVTSADLGQQISLKVTAKRAGYNDTPMTSVATAAVTRGLIASPPTPTLSVTTPFAGTVKAGNTLTVADGAAPAGATAKGYQWVRATSSTGVYSNIPNATAKSYTLTGTDTGKFIKATVIWSKAEYTDTPALSAATTVVAAGTFATSPAPVPTITGTLMVGSTLTANEGTWSTTPDSFKYKWFYSGTGGTYVEISGATSQTFAPTSLYVGKFLKVEIIAIKTGYTDSTAVRSAATATAIVAATP